MIILDACDDVEDDGAPHPNIADCQTDVEDLDSDNPRVPSPRVSLMRPDEATAGVTDVEDCADSDDNSAEPEADYGPEISLNEYLDQGCVDESSDVKGKGLETLNATHSAGKRPSVSAFGITNDLGGVTDVEDMVTSGDEAEDSVEQFSADDIPIILEGTSDVQESMQKNKKVEKFAPRIVPSTRSPSASSSDSEEEKPKARLKHHKHSHKRPTRIQDAKSDIECMTFSDDNRKKKGKKPLPLETPDIEVMAWDGSENEDVPETPKFPQINISFAIEDKTKKKTKFRKSPMPGPTLALPDNQDEGHTDVENLNSSDDDDEEEQPKGAKARPKSLIPIAVIKSDALTDVEDFDSDASDDEGDWEEKFEMPLPSPVREMTRLIENNAGEPIKQTTPLPDNVLLGMQDLDADKGLTDVEDYSDDSEGEQEKEETKYDIESIPDLDGGVVESSDHQSNEKGSSLNISVTPEPITDTEEIYGKKSGKGSDCRRRRNKPRHSQNKQKSNFLGSMLHVDQGDVDGHTDVEDLDVEDNDAILKDKGLKQRRRSVPNAQRKASCSSNPDGKTDTECLSGDDTVDLVRNSSPEETLFELQMETNTTTSSRDAMASTSQVQVALEFPRKLSAYSEYGTAANTESEDCQCTSDYEDAVSYSRAQTATPMQLNRDLEELCASQVHEVHSGAFDRTLEYSEIKENICLVESQTDVENIEGDEN